jgi:chemotaxis response regulator CheB
VPELSIALVHSSAIIRHAVAKWLAGRAKINAFSSIGAALGHCTRSPCSHMLLEVKGGAHEWGEQSTKLRRAGLTQIVAIVDHRLSVAEDQALRAQGAIAALVLAETTSESDDSAANELLALCDRLEKKKVSRAIRSGKHADTSPGDLAHFACAPSNGAELPPVSYHGRPRVIAIGVSTGGPETLQALLPLFPADTPPVLIVQHMPPGYTAMLAASLNEQCVCTVAEARAGDALESGRILIAPAGEQHLEVGIEGGRLVAVLSSSPARNRHRPSADVLFESVATTIGSAAVGIILTGMGEDGAQGLLEMARSGARTLAQDEKTSRVFGMPRAAIALGAAREVYAIGDMAASLFAGFSAGASTKLGRAG